MSESHDLSLMKLFLPEGILEYFEMTNFVLKDEVFNIHLEEKNIIPAEFVNEKLKSKGFLDEIIVQDFPIRGKAVYLKIKRRRWLNEATGHTVCRNWELVAKGTRLTKDFAAFLKEIYGYKSGKL